MSTPSPLRIVTLHERPDLAPVVADWIWTAFWKPECHPLHVVEALVQAATAGLPIPQAFVLLDDAVPVATASLVAHDLDARPDLTPWLAAVFVTPAARRRGLAGHLVKAVEDAARRDLHAERLWLYTRTAERIYHRCGWQTHSTFQHHDLHHVLMDKALR